MRAIDSAGRFRIVACEIPAAETRTSFWKRSAPVVTASAATKPPIELPTTTALGDPELVAEVVQKPPVGLDRQIPGRHRRGPEARQVERDDAV